MMLHEGMYLDPVMRNIEKFLDDSQRAVSGRVFVKLRPYSFEILGIDSENDLMKATGAAYGEMNEGWSGEDVQGFTRIISNSLRLHQSMHKFEY